MQREIDRELLVLQFEEPRLAADGVEPVGQRHREVGQRPQVVRRERHDPSADLLGFDSEFPRLRRLRVGTHEPCEQRLLDPGGPQLQELDVVGRGEQPGARFLGDRREKRRAAHVLPKNVPHLDRQRKRLARGLERAVAVGARAKPVVDERHHRKRGDQRQRKGKTPLQDGVPDAFERGSLARRDGGAVEPTVEIAQERVDRLVAIASRARSRLRDDCIEVRIDPFSACFSQLRRTRKQLLEHDAQRLREVVRRKRPGRAHGREFQQHEAKPEDVGARVERRPSRDERLGAHGRKRADRPGQTGQLRAFAAGCAHRARDAEVDHLRVRLAADHLHEDVRGLQVAVQDAQRMRGADRCAGLEEELDARAQREFRIAAILDDSAAADALHHHVGAAIGGDPVVVDARDVRMLERRERLSLRLNARREPRFGGVFEEKLDGDLALDRRLLLGKEHCG